MNRRISGQKQKAAQYRSQIMIPTSYVVHSAATRNHIIVRTPHEATTKKRGSKTSVIYLSAKGGYSLVSRKCYVCHVGSHLQRGGYFGVRVPLPLPRRPTPWTAQGLIYLEWFISKVGRVPVTGIRTVVNAPSSCLLLKINTNRLHLLTPRKGTGVERGRVLFSKAGT